MVGLPERSRPLTSWVGLSAHGPKQMGTTTNIWRCRVCRRAGGGQHLIFGGAMITRLRDTELETGHLFAE